LKLIIKIHSKKQKPRVKHIEVGKKFMEEDYNPRVDGKKKKKRMLRNGKVDIS